MQRSDRTADAETDRVRVGHGELEVLRLPGEQDEPTIVFLHEGLGSVSHWRSFPADVVAATGLPGLVYSRFGHGWSSSPDRPRDVAFMHREAEVLAALLATEGIERPILLGHSDGATIALLAAAGEAVAPRGVVGIAPHVVDEPAIASGIAAAKAAWEDTDFLAQLGRFHADAAATFSLWYDAWSSPSFRSFDITDALPAIPCPLLMLQGSSDEYATLVHLDEIEARVSGRCERLVILGAGHAPQRSHPQETLAAVRRFVTGLR